MDLVKRFKEEKGQGLVEYALILVLVALFVMIMLIIFGEDVVEFYCRTLLTLEPYGFSYDQATFDATCPTGLTPF